MSDLTPETLEAGRELTDFLRRKKVAEMVARWAERAVDYHNAGGELVGPTIRFPNGVTVHFNVQVWQETTPILSVPHPPCGGDA